MSIETSLERIRTAAEPVIPTRLYMRFDEAWPATLICGAPTLCLMAMCI